MLQRAQRSVPVRCVSSCGGEDPDQFTLLLPTGTARAIALPAEEAHAVVLSPGKPDMFTGKRDWGVNFRRDGDSY